MLPEVRCRERRCQTADDDHHDPVNLANAHVYLIQSGLLDIRPMNTIPSATRAKTIILASRGVTMPWAMVMSDILPTPGASHPSRSPETGQRHPHPYRAPGSSGPP